MSKKLTGKKGSLFSPGRLLAYAVLIAAAIVFATPFVWMVSASLKEGKEVMSWPIKWIPEVFHFENYSEALSKIPFGLYFFNSAKLTIITVIVQLFTSSFAAYGFSKMKFPGRDKIFLCYIATLAIPYQVYMVPQYIMMSRAGLVNTHLGLIIMSAFTPFGVFLLRQFCMGIPDELCEVARIDGMSEFGIWWRIVLPLTKPALATLALTTFIFVWNDFFRTYIYIDSASLKTLQLGIREFMNTEFTAYHLICAASVIALIPVLILFIFLQKYFVEGIATSGMKG